MRTTAKYDKNEAGPVKLAAARAEFDAEVTYLNTATFGLPPRRSWLALQHALAGWRAGTADPVAYDAPLAAARSSYARLVGVDPSAVAVGSQVSVFAGLIAANLPDGSEVLTATGDFTSILFPFLAQSGRGVQVREVPLEQIADAVTPHTRLVSVSAVQSANGRVIDLDALHAATKATGTRVLLDTTQAVGWLPARTGLESSPVATATRTGHPALPAGCAGNGPPPGCRRGNLPSLSSSMSAPSRSRPDNLSDCRNLGGKWLQSQVVPRRTRPGEVLSAGLGVPASCGVREGNN